MKKAALALTLAFALLISLTVVVQSAKSSPKTITVPDDYPTIQAAIGNASSGDILHVKNGIYKESIVVDKPLSIVGEEKETTIIDGGGAGTVVRITSSNVDIANFTIRNAGTSPWSGHGFPNSCIDVEISTNVTIFNCHQNDATVGVWSYGSSNVNFVKCSISDTNTMGIVYYSCVDSTISGSVFQNCGIVGLHLDGDSTNCKVINNTVSECEEGIEIEKSFDNIIEQNLVIDNNASIILNKCGTSNTLSNNIMNGLRSNLIVLGTDQDSYMQRIDTSNLADGKNVYYIVGSADTTFDGSGKNIGYLAVVNCTKLKIENVDLRDNKDGLFIVSSTNCTLFNITLTGNGDNLIVTGLIFVNSNGNLVQDCLIENNYMGVGFFQSNGNTFTYNSFVNNTLQVISDFSSPFASPSGALSVNKWEDGKEGNYWSDYQSRYPNASEVDASAVWNTPYVIDANNIDHYPLMKPLPVQEFPSWITLLPLVIIAAGLLLSSKKRKH